MIRRDRKPIVTARRSAKLTKFLNDATDEVLKTLEEDLPNMDPMAREDLAGYIVYDLRAAKMLKIPRIHSTPDNCEKCERPLRAKNTRAEDHPGKFAHAGYGLCTACYQYEEGNGSEEMPTHCTRCEKPVRLRRALLTEFPGTVGYHGRGLCQGCYRKQKKEQRAEK